MAGPCSTFTCRLYRDGLQTPWGFRLQGGKDFNQPLTVQRVFTGSPAEGELQRGDVIIKINNTDVGQLNHKEAQDIIKTPAGQLVLNIQRGQTRFSPVKSMQQQPSFHAPAAPSGFRSVPFESSPGPKPYAPPTGGLKTTTNFAVDYTARVGSPQRRPEQSMINRVHDSLNEAIAAHQSGEHEDDYNYGTVNDRKKLFSQDIRAPVVHSPGRPSRSGKVWRPPQQYPSTERPKEFGWTPSRPAQPGYRAGPPSQERAYTPPRHAPPPKRAPVTTHFPAEEGAYPAWKGTLHGAGESAGPPLQAPAPRSGDKEMDYTTSYAWQMTKGESGGGGAPSQSAPSQDTAEYHDTKQSRSFRALEHAVGASDF